MCNSEVVLVIRRLFAMDLFIHEDSQIPNEKGLIQLSWPQGIWTGLTYAYT